MARPKKLQRRPHLTIISGNGSMRSSWGNRPRQIASIGGVPTRIYFSKASSTPTGGSLAILRRHADWLADRRSRRIVVLGHANQRSWPEAARVLARARARAVRDLLVFLGAKSAQIRRTDVGKLYAAEASTTSSERRSHRYVELIRIPGDRLPVEMLPPLQSRAGGRELRRSSVRLEARARRQRV